MKVSRGGVVLAGDELVEGGLLGLVAAQDKNQVSHGERGANGPAIVPGIGGGVGVAAKSNKVALINAVDDTNSRSGGFLGRCGHFRNSREQHTGQCKEGKQTHQAHMIFLAFPDAGASEKHAKLRYLAKVLWTSRGYGQSSSAVSLRRVKQQEVQP